MLTHTRIDTRANLADFAGGWTAHLNTLADVLIDRAPPFWSYVVTAHERYAQDMAP